MVAFACECPDNRSLRCEDLVRNLLTDRAESVSELALLQRSRTRKGTLAYRTDRTLTTSGGAC